MITVNYVSDLQKAKTNSELAIQILANNPTKENADFSRLQKRIYDHVNYGKMTLFEANKKEKLNFFDSDFVLV
tara:strand:- start:1042 stop:1260 length:219 start_codon:yes stop_codon:yes gene_type:complete